VTSLLILKGTAYPFSFAVPPLWLIAYWGQGCRLPQRKKGKNRREKMEKPALWR
jgi:hypothetical protein